MIHRLVTGARYVRRCGVVLGVLLCLAAVAGAGNVLALDSGGWQMAGYDGQSTFFNPGERVLGANTVGHLHTAWSYPGIYRAITTGGSVIGLVRHGLQNQIVVLNARTGGVLKVFTPSTLHLASPQSDSLQALAYANGRLIVAATHQVAALDPSSGQLFWTVPGGATAVTVDHSVAYTGQSCRQRCAQLAAVAIDLRTGQVLWRHPGNFSGPAVLLNRRVYQVWGAAGNETRVFEPSTGSLVATLLIGAQWTGDLADSYALQLQTAAGGAWSARIGADGKQVWRADLSAARSGNAVFAYHALFVPSNRHQPGGILALAPGNGKPYWGAAIGPITRLIAANHLLYTLRADRGQVDILRATTGDVLKRIILPGFARGQPGDLMVDGGALYVIANGKLTAMRP